MAASTTLTAEQRSTRARLAAFARWSREDPAATAVRGQAGLIARFHREILAEHPDLSDAELGRRVEARRREHMARLSFASSKARSRKARPSYEDGGEAA